MVKTCKIRDCRPNIIYVLDCITLIAFYKYTTRGIQICLLPVNSTSMTASLAAVTY